MPAPETETKATESAQEAACHLCGQPAATEIGGQAWCASCLHARGSCCAESEMDED
ncbi:hypothetical protein [Haloferula sp. BvORR071]|uniref:hypothetical protein n=1 Tax=Haloferula sp. BvORR071 TaxID=1396141 RepID=UPI002240EFD1|nr:hypothetical protein [Haloferula sp. BvORR071]